MNEIGGYLGLEGFTGAEYYPDLIAVNSARGALLYIIRAKNIRKLYLPHYLCDSVSRLCDREGCPYELYHVGKDFLPVFDKTLQNQEYMYVVNYFGQLTEEMIAGLKKTYGNVIVDNVQAFFQEPVSGVDTIYSCRKYFGVPDGGYVSTETVLGEALPQDSSTDRMRHILGRFEGSDATAYYRDFKANEAMLDKLELRAMSKLTHSLLQVVDYHAVKERRERNYAMLHEKLGVGNLLKIAMPVGPFAYPFYCTKGIEARKRLAEQKIYVPTLWPNTLESNDPIAKDYTANILPLPCDQRYGRRDMERVISAMTEISMILNTV